MSAETDKAKHATRTKVWDLLERERAAGSGVHGYIPAFVGADTAAHLPAQLPVWRASPPGRGPVS